MTNKDILPQVVIRQASCLCFSVPCVWPHPCQSGRWKLRCIRAFSLALIKHNGPRQLMEEGFVRTHSAGGTNEAFTRLRWEVACEDQLSDLSKGVTHSGY